MCILNRVCWNNCLIKQSIAQPANGRIVQGSAKTTKLTGKNAVPRLLQPYHMKLTFPSPCFSKRYKIPSPISQWRHAAVCDTQESLSAQMVPLCTLPPNTFISMRSPPELDSTVTVLPGERAGSESLGLLRLGRR